MEKHIVKAKQYGSSQISEINEIWKNIPLRQNNIVLFPGI